MQLTVTIANDEILKKLANAGEVVDQASQAFLKKSQLIALTEAKILAPKDKTTLAKSLTGDDPKKDGSGWWAAIGSNVLYALWQEEGTGIYGKRNAPITPKRAKMLRFETKAGKIVFARSVRGTKPKEFLKKGVEKLQNNIDLAFSEADKIIQAGL